MAWKLFLIVAICVTSSISSVEIWNSPPIKFLLGNDYVYKYDAQIVSGIELSAWQYTGYRLQAQVTLSLKKANQVTMSLSKMNFSQLNTTIPINEPTVLLPVELFHELSDESLSTNLINELKKPLRFRWRNGVVRHLEVEQTDSYWSVNIKKGILNLLHMPWKEQVNDELARGFRQSEYEEGIEGKCKSLYRLNRLPIQTQWENEQLENNRSVNSIPMEMEKIRNIKDCTISGQLDEFSIFQRGCHGQYEMGSLRDELVQGEVKTRGLMNYWKDSQEIFLWKIESDAQYNISLSDMLTNSMSSFVKQSLLFVEVRDTLSASLFGGANPADAKFNSEDTLQMKIVPEEGDSSEKGLKTLHWRLLEHLSKIEEQQGKLIDSNYLNLVQRWIPMLRLATRDILSDLGEKCSQNRNLTRIYYDILPFVGTPAAWDILLDEDILTGRKKDMDDFDVARRLRTFSMSHRLLKPNTVRQLMKVIKNPSVLKSKRKEILKALIESVGEMAGILQSIPELVSPSLSKKGSQNDQKFFLEVFYFYRNLEKQDLPEFQMEEKFKMIFRGLRNLATTEVLSYLNNMIYERNVSLSVKVEATYSLLPMMVKFPSAVKRILMPNLFDVNQQLILRIASYRMIMKSPPEFSELVAIAETIARDPSVQVKDFIRSHLHALSQGLTGQCEAELAANATRILEIFNERSSQGWHQSQFISFPLMKSSFSCQGHRGILSTYRDLTLESTVLWPNEDLLPQLAEMEMFSDSCGMKKNILQISMQQEGLQLILNQLMGLPQSTKPESESSNPYLELNLSLFGEKLQLLSIQGKDTENFQRQFQNLSRNWFHFLSGKEPLTKSLSRLIFTDQLVRLPTTFGLELYINATAMFLAEARGLFHLKSIQTSRTHFLGALSIEPKFLSENFVEFGIDGAVVKSSHQMKVELNMLENTKIELNMMFDNSSRERLQIHVEQPTSSWNLFQMNVSLSSVKTQNMSTEVHPIQVESHQEPGFKEYNISIPLRPFPLELNAHLTGHPSLLIRDETDGNFLLQPGSSLVRLVNTGPHVPGEGLHLGIPLFNEKLNENTPINSIIIFSKMQWQSNEEFKRVENDANHSRLPRRESSSAREILGSVRFSLTQEDTVNDVVVDIPIRIYSSTPQLIYSLETSIRMKKNHSSSFNATDPMKISVFDHSVNTPVITIDSSLLYNKDDTKLAHIQIRVDADPQFKDLLHLAASHPSLFTGLKPEIGICFEEASQNQYGTPSCRAASKQLNSFNRFNLSVVFHKNLTIYDPSWLLTNWFMESDTVSVISPSSDIENDFITANLSCSVNPLHRNEEQCLVELHNSIQATRRVQLDSRKFPFLSLMATDIWEMALSSLTVERHSVCLLNWQSSSKSIFIQTFDRLFYHFPGEILEKPLNVDYLYRAVVAQDLQKQFQFAYFFTQFGFGIDIVTPALPEVKRLSLVQSDAVGIFLNGDLHINELPYTRMNDQDQVILHINFLEESTEDYDEGKPLLIQIPTLGIEIVTDLRNNVKLQVSSIYHSQLRGLCGDFNGDTYQELKDPMCSGFLVDHSLIRHSKFGYITRYPVDSLKDMTRLEERFFLPLRDCSPRGPTPVSGGPLKPITTLE